MSRSPNVATTPTTRVALGIVLLAIFSALLATTYGMGAQQLFTRALLLYSFIQSHAWLLLGLYVLRLVLFLPASLVIFLTGMLCGPLWGELVAVLGLTLSGSIEFLLVRSAFSAIPVGATSAFVETWQMRINQAPFRSISLARLCFVPFDVVNIGAALAKAPFKSFVAATVLGITPTSLPIVISGASISFQTWIARGKLLPDNDLIDWKYLGISIGLALLIALWGARRKAQID